MTMTVVELGGPPYGNFDQCLSIESPDEENKPKIKGKYCAADMSWIMDIKEEELDADLFNKMKEDAFNNGPINIKNLYFQLLGAFAQPSMGRNETHDFKYTLEYLEYIMPRELKLINGFCLPTTCSNEDLSRVINNCKSKTKLLFISGMTKKEDYFHLRLPPSRNFEVLGYLPEISMDFAIIYYLSFIFLLEKITILPSIYMFILFRHKQMGGGYRVNTP